MVTELRFPSPGWKLYIRGALLILFGAALLVLGIVIVAVDPWDFAGVISMLGGILCAVVGLVILLLIWFSLVYGTVNIWRQFRQLRQPASVIDAEGVRFLAHRRPTRIPWSDIEEIHIDRDLLPGSIVTKATVRMAPDAGVLREGPVRVPSTRYLNLGLIRDAGVPEDAAVAYLRETAGPRLRVTETDRRTPSATHGYS